MQLSLDRYSRRMPSMGRVIEERLISALCPKLPLGRPGHAREIAAWVAFLASERSSYATSASLVVDSSLTLMAAESSS
jgi:NAD(P)-dependent dehydrogenase (short-subunit alcohol dehydrogenase family)